MIQKSASDQPRNNQPRNDQPRNNQQRVERPVRQFTKINMTPAQVLPHILKLNLAMLKEAPKNPNTSSPHYHPKARCAYHSETPGHDTNNCWALKNKIQDLIDAKEVEFEAPKKPNVISALMHRHGHNDSAVEEDLFVSAMDELLTPLLTIKLNLLKAGVFPGCDQDCLACMSSPFDCPLLKKRIQQLIGNKEILFEKALVSPIPVPEVSIITIYANPSRVPKKPVIDRKSVV